MYIHVHIRGMGVIPGVIPKWMGYMHVQMYMYVHVCIFGWIDIYEGG